MICLLPPPFVDSLTKVRPRIALSTGGERGIQIQIVEIFSAELCRNQDPLQTSPQDFHNSNIRSGKVGFCKHKKDADSEGNSKWFRLALGWMLLLNHGQDMICLFIRDSRFVAVIDGKGSGKSSPISGQLSGRVDLCARLS